MSDPTIKISPKGAFSLYWNQCLDHNTSCFIRVGKSIAGFFEALFCGRTVSKSEAGIDTVLQGVDHRKSVFSKECIRKFKTLNIDIVKELGSEKQETNDEKQESKKNDPTAVSTNPDRQEPLKNENNEPKEDPATRLNVEKVSVDTLTTLLKSDFFQESDDRFSEQSLKLLKPDDCLLLFSVALGEGHREIALRCLLTGNCSGLVDLATRQKADILSFFARRGMVHGVKYLLENNLVDVNDKDGKGVAALHYVASGGYGDPDDDVKCLSILVEKGANVHEADNQGFTPLHYAATEGNVACLNALVEKGANAKMASVQGLMPLHCAAKSSREDCLKALLDVDPSVVDVPTLAGMTPLSYAAYFSQTGCVKILINVEGVDVNAVDTNGDTALHMASLVGSEECIKVILTHTKIKIDLFNSDGMTPLSKALRNGNVKCAWVLLKNNANINEKNNNGLSPLFFAVEGLSPMNFKPFLHTNKPKLDLDVKDSHDNTLIHHAVAVNKSSNLKDLLEVEDIRTQINEKNSDGDTVLHCVIKKDQLEYLRMLLGACAKEFDAEVMDKKGHTLLDCIEAGGRGSSKEYQKLLLAKANKAKAQAQAQAQAQAHQEMES